MIFRKQFLMLATCAIASVVAWSPSAHAFNDKEKQEIGSIVEEYILENPGLIMKALEKHQVEEKKRSEQEAMGFIKDNWEALASKDLPSVGAEDADVTVIEFFDYNCGYCKRALPDIINLVDQDKNVRVVFHEFPILSKESREAALWALAAHKQDKYFEFHAETMRHRGTKDDAALERIAEKSGLDVKQAKADAKSDEVAAELATSMRLAQQIGINGTPAFIVGDQLFPGYIGHDGLRQAIEKAREKK